MSDNSMFAFMDILIVAAGTYLVYVWYLLQFRNVVKPGVLLPSQKQGGVHQCKDIEGYKKAMSWKLLAFAISALLAGGVGLYSDYVKPINTYVYLALTGIFLVILILYARAAKQAEKEFFT